MTEQNEKIDREEPAENSGTPDAGNAPAAGEEAAPAPGKPKKKVAPYLLTALCAVLLTALLTLLYCYRYMFLETKQAYERRLAELSEELAPAEDKTKFKDPADKFNEIYQRFIDVYPGDGDDENIEKAVLAAFAASCGDGNARIYSAGEYAELTKSQGSAAGIGVTVSRTADDRAIITWVEEQGPAKEAGVERGDELIAVDGSALAEAGYDAGLALIRGKENSTVTLTVKRGEETRNIAVTRRKVTYSTVHARYDGEHACGYVELLSLASGTPEEFEEALTGFEEQGMQRLIIDLRGNSGGSLTALHKLSDRLLSDEDGDGKPREIFFTKDAKENVRRYVCSDEKDLTGVKIAVLTDGATAHEAEILASVLRTHAGAKVIGKQTAGKVFLRSQYTLKDGTVLIFTTAYCRPFPDEDLTGKGVTPDAEAECTANRYLISPEEDPCYAAALAETGNE